MKNRKITLLVTLAILLSFSIAIARQAAKKQPMTAAPNSVEPVRVISGELHGNTVTGQVKQGWRAKAFSFSLTKAEIVGGRLRLSGDFALHGAPAQTSEQVTATLGGVISIAVNPWPNARQERQNVKKSKQEDQKAGGQQQGREAKTPEAAAQLGQLAQSTQDTARKTPTVPGDKTEQTQSIDTQSDTGTACGVLFLKLSLPRRVRARIGTTAEQLQLGVVPRSFNNRRGEEIVKQICLLLQTSEAPTQSANLDQLNRLFASSKQ